MQLDKLTVNNFGSFIESSYEFKDGLWLIEGINEDKDGSSNGSGKSIFFVDAPVWLLFDQTCRGARYDSVIRKDSKDVIVTGVFGDLEIQRSKVRSKGSIVTINGEQVKQEQLEEIIGMDFNSFTSSVIHAQSFLGFTEMGETEQKGILTKLMGLEVWDKYKAVTDKAIQTILYNIAVINRDFSYFEQRKKELENKDFSKLRKDFENNKEEKIKAINKHIEIYKNSIRESEEKLKEISIIVKKEKLFKRSLKSITAKIHELTEEKEVLCIDERKVETDLNFNYKELKRNIKDSERIVKLEGNCPTCLQKVTESSKDKCLAEISENINKIKTEVTVLETRQKELKDKVKIYEKELSELTKQLQSYEKEISNINSSKQLVKTVEDYIKNSVSSIESYKKEIEEVKKETYAGDLFEFEIKKELEELEVNIKNCNTKLIQEQEILKYYQFWETGFSNRGIKSYIFDSLMPEFTIKANYYIQALTNSNIQLYFDTRREKKSGGYSEKFTILISDENGERPFNTWSGGEKKRISVAVDLALGDIVLLRGTNIWDFMILDEVFDGLDSEGKEMTMYLLEDIMKERKRIYIISHDATMNSMVDNRILVRKHGGVSKIEG